MAGGILPDQLNLAAHQAQLRTVSGFAGGRSSINQQEDEYLRSTHDSSHHQAYIFSTESL